MKKKKSLNIKFYGVVVLFVFIVSIVELVKNVMASKVYSQVLDQNQDSHALIVLPIFSIAVVLLLAVPRKNL